MAMPFLFGVLALTGIMLLNLIGRRFAQLWSKGIPWSVIGEVFFLSLPFILAMSLPLAVLVATLYTFTQLATDSEITAMRAGGVSTVGMLRPVLGFAIAMGLVTFFFIDQVLPRANASLRNLYYDIGRKKPTFSLDESSINGVPPTQFFLRASRISATGQLTSVSIYDIGQSDHRRVIYADSGLMGYDPSGRDLILRLYDGSVQDVSATDRAAFQHTAFKVQEIVFSDVFDELERGEDKLDRGDREMTTCELLGVVDSARWERKLARTQRKDLTGTDLHLLLGLLPPPAAARPDPPTAPYRGAYCGLALGVRGVIGGGTSGNTGSAQETGATAARGKAAEPEAAPVSPAAVPSAAASPATTPAAPRLTDFGTISAASDREKSATRRSDRYLVEIHKKWSISFASIPFVLIAVVMALRFPRGGMGLVMGGGMFVYSIFYVGLNAGESLADRGHVPPGLAMWSPNIILGTLALIGLVSIHREYGSSRGKA
jgi:lipopolysaccharide export system permease protein